MLDLKKAPLLFRKAHAIPWCGRGMQRVVVVGGGLAGLAAALEAASSGHKVVVLEARDRLGGRATTTPGRYADLGHGPHVLLRGGTMHRLVRRLSRTRPATVALAPHRLNVIGHGPLRSLRSVRATASIRRTLRSSSPSEEPAAKAARLLAGWGLPALHGPLAERAEALYMGHGLLLQAGWADLIGRILAALDEVGVPIETNAKVIAVEDGCVHLEDGRDVEADLVVVAAGPRRGAALLEQQAGPAHRVSTVEALLDAAPFGEHQGLIDIEEGMVALRLPHSEPAFTHLSAIAVPRMDEDDEARMARLEGWLDRYLAGWQSAVAEDRRQAGLDLAVTEQSPASANGVVLVEPHLGLSDALIDTTRASVRSALSGDDA